MTAHNPLIQGFNRFVTEIRRRRLLALSVTLSLSIIDAIVAASIYAKSQSVEVEELKLGVPIERELAGGQSHSYQIKLGPGQYARAVAEQKGIDVVIKVFGPDGKQVAEVDRVQEGEDAVDLMAEAGGAYHLEI